MANRQTFFHVGYARAASTFLQKIVFPALRGIQYVPRNRFRVREKEKKRFREDKILMSREAGQYIYERTDDVKRIFGSKILISLRRHDALAASTYRLQAKNGHTLRFKQFLDVENDQGVWKIADFEYMALINYIIEKYDEKPLVLLFEDYLAHPDYYIDTLCKWLDCDIERSALSKKAVHGSYSDKQLRLRRQFSERFLDASHDHERYSSETLASHTPWRAFKHRCVLWFTGIFMRLARFAPDSWLNDEPLIEERDLQEVREFYTEDWQKCLDYVAEQSERIGVPRPS
ncbi:MAG: hypothetical protein AAF197_09590 [Pseudomonadota bacterium]